MCIATILGVADVDGPLITAARNAWPTWAASDPELDVVDDLLDLPRWLRARRPAARNPVLQSLAGLAAADQSAAAAMAWLLVPGAKRLGARLSDLHRDIDGLIAGQLWVEIRRYEGSRRQGVARTILRSVEHAIHAEFAIGDHGVRADRTWAATRPYAEIEATMPPVLAPHEPDGERILRAVFEAMMAAGLLNVDDVHAIASAANQADWLGKPLRGRAGLTSPQALEVQAARIREKARSVRRHVGALLDQVSEFVRNTDIEQLLEDAPDYEIAYGDWILGLGRPMEASCMARFREYEMATLRVHVRTWNEATGGCALDPDLCPACIREANAA